MSGREAFWFRTEEFTARTEYLLRTLRPLEATSSLADLIVVPRAAHPSGAMITRPSAQPLRAVSKAPWVCPSCVSLPCRKHPPCADDHNQARTPPFFRQTLRHAQQRRALYNVPRLNFHEHFEKNGINGLFSPNGYALGWTAYQSLMVQKLNELTAGRHFANRDPKDLALQFAHNPRATSTFNHASMAHNNHFFYQQFSTAPRQLDSFSDLQGSFADQFGSIDTLRTTFVDTAANMFGPGFVWLVWARDPDNLSYRNGSWKILCTYNGGTPYPEAGFMRQGLDMNTNNAAGHQQFKSSLAVGYMGPSSDAAKEKARLPPGGTTVMPVMCASTWEHTYVYDFGLHGKMRYLNDFWDAVDWHVINNRTPKNVGNLMVNANRTGKAATI